MDAAESVFHDIVEKVRSWIPTRTESSAMSRDFWMPDGSCRVCYDCDSQFSLFNRRHHCRNCGRVFCGKCTQNTLPVVDECTGSEEGDRVRVCNFCFKLRQQQAANLNGTQISTPTLSPSSSSRSLASTSTSGSSTVSSSGHLGHMPTGSGFRVLSAEEVEPLSGIKQRMMIRPRRKRNISVSPGGRELSPSAYDFCSNRSDEEDNQGQEDHRQSILSDERRNHQEEDDSCAEMDLADATHKIQPIDLSFQHMENYGAQKADTSDEGSHADNVDMKDPSYHSVGTVDRSLSRRSGMSSDDYEGTEESADDSNFYTPSYQAPAEQGEEPVDLENNEFIWVPPPPEDEEDETGTSLIDEDDLDNEGGWGLPHSSGSLSSSEYRSREKAASEEQRKNMRAVVDGHFRNLVAQLLNGEGIQAEEDDEESWLQIVMALSLQAATSVKPDTSRGGGMDPGGYVKVKCVATGRRIDSYIVKGVVCKKNVAHKRMISRFKNPRLLLLGGALEYQRVSNQLSSLDTLLQQERDHLSMTVARIEAHHPNVLLVEKTVSRFAQDQLLAKEISLVLNVKRPLLERIARCTGAQIVPTSDNLAVAKAGHCELFHVEKYVEEHGSSGQAGKQIPKTLMFLEGCPKPLGCTVLLKGANVDELKKVKRVLQFAVFAAYHLALETSFLADEGATLPELPCKSPISVALPDKQSKSDRSISSIPGFLVPASGQIQTWDAQIQQLGPNISVSPYSSNVWGESGVKASGAVLSASLSANSSCLSSRTNSPGSSPQILGFQEALFNNALTKFTTKPSLHDKSGPPLGKISSSIVFGHPEQGLSGLSVSLNRPSSGTFSISAAHEPTSENLSYYERAFDVSARVDGMPFASETSQTSSSNIPSLGEGHGLRGVKGKLGQISSDVNISPEPQFTLQMESQDGLQWEDQESNQEDFPPLLSDHQSILVSLSSRCLRKESVCERGHLFRIKYYGSSDRPLGRFLRDEVFDLNKKCTVCEEPRDAHLHCYTHRQGSLTISVRRQDQVLPGDKDGKIWMWHRCLKCSRVNGVPLATRRVVMSDAAWGLSFGKFLELSFSNHVAASRVAACGHSLHRDCLRFYGFGSIVACFRYAPINVLSVYLPPAKLEFNNHEQQDWLRNEVNEVADKGNLVFAEVFDTLRQIGEKIASYGSGKVPEARRCQAELEALLQQEKAGFEEALQKAAPMKCQQGQPVADLLELNSLRRRLAVCSIQWVRCLQYLESFLKLCASTTGSELILSANPSVSSSKQSNFENDIPRPSDHQEAQGYAVNNLDSLQLVQTQVAVGPVGGGVVPPVVAVFSQQQPVRMSLNSVNTFVLDDVKGIAYDAGTVKSLDINVNYVVEKDSTGCTNVGKEAMLSSNDQMENSEAFSLINPLSAGAEDLTLYKNSILPNNSESMSDTVDSCSIILEGDIPFQRPLSGDFTSVPDLSDTFEVAWTGGHTVEAQTVQIGPNGQEIISLGAGSDINLSGVDSANGMNLVGPEALSEGFIEQSSKSSSVSSTSSQERGVGSEALLRNAPPWPIKRSEELDSLGGPFSTLYKSYIRFFQSSLIGSPPWAEVPTSSSIVSCEEWLAAQGGARMLLPLGINDTVIPVYDDEPTSIIAYAITSHEYQARLSDRSVEKDRHNDKERVLKEKQKEEPNDSLSLETVTPHPLQFAENFQEQVEIRPNNSDEDFLATSMEAGASNPLLYSKAMHVKVTFSDDVPQGKITFVVTCYYAKQFDALRKKCCPNELDFTRSLCRCKKWGAQGGKSNVFFAKTADDRFVIKQVTKTELESFIKFAPDYFKYLSDALNTGSPTCLAKILGIYQVTIKHGKAGKEIRMDLMVMENLLYGRHVTRVYDLKGSLRSRYNSDATGKNKVLLDQNLRESMQTNPIFIGNKAKRLLERAVWNDTSFLAFVDVMDYSLLVGVDEERRELVLGIIDFMRQYTWDKHLETWVKASGILGGRKNEAPTVISPKQYKKRFRKAMNSYFLMVPDQWSPPTAMSVASQVETSDDYSLVAIQDEAVQDTIRKL